MNPHWDWERLMSPIWSLDLHINIRTIWWAELNIDYMVHSFIQSFIHLWGVKERESNVRGWIESWHLRGSCARNLRNGRFSLIHALPFGSNSLRESNKEKEKERERKRKREREREREGISLSISHSEKLPPAACLHGFLLHIPIEFFSSASSCTCPPPHSA